MQSESGAAASEPLWDATFRSRLLRQALSNDEIAQAVEVAEQSAAERRRYREVLERIAADELAARESEDALRAVEYRIAARAALKGDPEPAMPWLPSEAAPNRVPPRECVKAARAALDETYALGQGVAAVPLIIEAVDWLRRALEQMTEENAR